MSLSLIASYYFLGVGAGLASWLWCEHLTAKTMLFAWVPRVLDALAAPDWVHKPLHACCTCNAFWVALAVLLFVPFSWLWLLAITVAMATATYLQHHGKKS